MKKKLPIILLGVILACVLVFGFLYANNDIGKTANSLEADIRQSQKILDDWIVDGSISDTMAAFISYPQDKTDHTFSVYVNRPGLSFGYFFRGGGDIVEVDDYIAEFVVEGNNERAFISMNTQNIVRLEVDDGNGIQVIDIDSGKPFAIVLPLNVGNICFYDTNGNGLKADGTVVATGYNEYGQCDVLGWTDIVSVSAGNDCTIGLKTDGTVVAVGYNEYGQCDVLDWVDIVAVSAGHNHTIGLKADGTVVAAGRNHFGQCNVSDWVDIVAVSAGHNHTIGLKADGTLVATGSDRNRQCDVSDWTNITTKQPMA